MERQKIKENRQLKDNLINIVVAFGSTLSWSVISNWIRLHLPSCGPGFDPQAKHLCFFNLKLHHDGKEMINKERQGLAHFKKN